ncbi:MAG: UDP-N-acetylglucosamine 2-epimerase (non-hydrolyzing) [Bacteroidales bacterium]|jgi:UDP-GlcNAc3NAcA epimerase|nr:UDP-N-acetylglucosamine 2-epimerase (non-hydrolyzing) [Bacteroidales bacterium]MCK9447578.1 UDP-N-acetylglucosamine 2-epimerase (non-hydrolyzing) [Bacteroidales bacterium]MDD3701505.1 UDP-N-acetylglucosamine 2-epimerase (non-hydrolyzing) [Bacteroidales bacterium]MDY0369232.1 UDP-N-acetylglucosamine 2-epimerase (non-hydrolyzing) [Bacteroidales bacterium]
MKILTVIGARPQIIKAAALSRAIKTHYPDQIKEVIVHTGQHYDTNMSNIFFHELGIPMPDYNLGVGSASHGQQTAKMIEGIEKILIAEQPNYIVLYGDTNSTLAGAIAASKIHLPIVHIEAGLRSFNKSMPEEINRIVCDHCSTLLFTPTTAGYANLLNEGFKAHTKTPFTSDNPGVFHCGDVMYDNSLYFTQKAMEIKAGFLTSKKLKPNHYILSTIHRDHNTDQPERLRNIFTALLHIAQESKQPIYLPMHPRTSKLLEQNLGERLYKLIIQEPLIRLEQPASFLEMILLEKNASLIITDSGGVQKEAYFFQKACIILRSETEWTEIVDAGTALIADADTLQIINAWKHFNEQPPTNFPPLFGDGQAARFIAAQMLSNQVE